MGIIKLIFFLNVKKIITSLLIAVTRRVNGLTRFVGKYVTGRRKRFRPHKVYILTSRVDLAMSFCPSVRLSVRMNAEISRSSLSVSLCVRVNAEISETIRARLLGFGIQVPEFLAQRKFVSPGYHTHSNAHKPPKTVAPKCIVLINTYRLTQKKFAMPTVTPTNCPKMWRPQFSCYIKKLKSICLVNTYQLI